MAVQGIGITDVVTHHDVGAAEIVTHIAFQVLAVKEQQVLGYEFPLLR